jgi:hypothetical protein
VLATSLNIQGCEVKAMARFAGRLEKVTWNKWCTVYTSKPLLTFCIIHYLIVNRETSF